MREKPYLKYLKHIFQLPGRYFSSHAGPMGCVCAHAKILVQKNKNKMRKMKHRKFYNIRNIYVGIIILIMVTVALLYLLTPNISPCLTYSGYGSTFNFRANFPPPVLDLPALKQFCSKVEFRKDIYLECPTIPMGAFNAINKVQNCLRWSLDAGVGMIKPQFMPRDPKNISNLWDSGLIAPLEFLLDEQFFWKALKRNCPKFKIAERSELGETNVILGKYGRNGMNPTPFLHMRPGDYKRYFDSLLSNNLTSLPNFIPHAPVLVSERDTLFAWDVVSDSYEFYSDFHRLIHFSRPLVKVAQSMLENLPYVYFGIHLRVESDWELLKGTPTDLEMLQFILPHNKTAYPVVYTACGDSEKLSQFKNLGKKLGIIVLDKWDIIIEEEDKKVVASLQFDQLAVLDFVILQHCQFFFGLAGSSFSHTLGVWRHLEQFNDFYFFNADYQQTMIGHKVYLESFSNIFW